MLVDDTGAASAALDAVEGLTGEIIVTLMPLFEGVIIGSDVLTPTFEVGVVEENGLSFPCEVGVAVGGTCAAE